jgi:hypothetical protein
MQCILYKIYFFESFSYELQFDMHFYMHSYLHESFYSCKKWVLQLIIKHKVSVLLRMNFLLQLFSSTPCNWTSYIKWSFI